MQEKFGSAIHTLFKLVIITLLLGLGVNYGLLTPKGKNDLDFSGIFGDSSKLLVAITLSIYVVYRLALNIIRWIGTRKDKTNVASLPEKKQSQFSFARLAVNESILAAITIAPIVIGNYWSNANFSVTDFPFLISRIFSSFCIIASCGVIYMEKLNYVANRTGGMGSKTKLK